MIIVNQSWSASWSWSAWWSSSISHNHNHEHDQHDDHRWLGAVWRRCIARTTGRIETKQPVELNIFIMITMINHDDYHYDQHKNHQQTAGRAEHLCNDDDYNWWWLLLLFQEDQTKRWLIEYNSHKHFIFWCWWSSSFWWSSTWERS